MNITAARHMTGTLLVSLPMSVLNVLCTIKTYYGVKQAEDTTIYTLTIKKNGKFHKINAILALII